MVLVNKAGDEHIMCMDFTNLNKATPKDCFHLPNIDQLVNARGILCNAVDEILIGSIYMI